MDIYEHSYSYTCDQTVTKPPCLTNSTLVTPTCTQIYPNILNEPGRRHQAFHTTSSSVSCSAGPTQILAVTRPRRRMYALRVQDTHHSQSGYPWIVSRCSETVEATPHSRDSARSLRNYRREKWKKSDFSRLGLYYFMVLLCRWVRYCVTVLGFGSSCLIVISILLRRGVVGEEGGSSGTAFRSD